jgi:hypothetical protein
MKPRKKYIKSRQTKISEVRKEFYKRLLYIFLGIIPILLLFENNGPERYIGLAGFLFSMYQFIITIIMSQQILDDFFPPKTTFELKTKPFDKFIYYFAMTLFFCGIVFLIFEIHIIDNTVNGATFFWQSALIGFALASIITIILKLTKPSVYYESNRRYSVHFGFFVGFFLLTPAMSSFVNHNFAEITENCKTYEIVRKSTGGRRNKSSWLFLKLDKNSEERFVVSQTFYNNVSEGEQIKICTRKGKLGYDFVEEFKTINEWQ